MTIEDHLDGALQRLEATYAEMGMSTGNVLFRDLGPYRHLWRAI